VNSAADMLVPIKWTDVKQPYIPPVGAPSALPTGLACAVARIEWAVGRRDGSEKRAVPSAGACYPYEILISPLGSSVIGLIDLHRRRVVIRHDERDYWDGAEFAYFLIGRPWLSMRKYGRRGYLYHLLDVGHAILNLVLVAGDAGGSLHLIGPELAGKIAQQSSVCGGSLLGFGILEGYHDRPAARRWLLQQTFDAAVLSPPSDIERMVDPILPPPPQPVRLYLELNENTADLAKAIAKRRSAARLHDSVSVNEVECLTRDCAVLYRRVIPALGMPVPETRNISRSQLDGITLSSSEWMERALIGQSDLTTASAFIVVHSKVGDGAADVLTPSTQRLIISCGIAGELTYLSATRAGLGVTGIGGINPRLWADACGIADDVVYLVAIGDAMAGEKWDATTARGHHG
jgi:hypothetical protein